MHPQQATQQAMQPEASPRALSPACPLAGLPEVVLEDILLRSGPHARQVCRAFRAIRPPLRSLAPHDIDTPEELADALAALPRSLTSLSLRHVRTKALTPDTLAAVCALPHLQCLTVPGTSRSVLSSILNALHHLSQLHTLNVLDHRPSGYDFGPPPDVPWPTLLQAPIATRLRALALPMSALPTLRAGPSSTFPQLTALSFFYHSWNDNSAELASLLGPAPALRRLCLEGGDPCLGATSVEPLTALTTLTALSLNIYVAPMTDPLPAMGTLTSLRSLRMCVHIWQPTGYPYAPASGWLHRLVLLTRLHVDFYLHEGDDDPDDIDAPPPLLDEPVAVPARLISELAQAVETMPQLRDLRLSLSEYHTVRCDLDWLARSTEHSFFRHLATATQLRRLQLRRLPLPPQEACLLSRLQGLTSLCIESCGTTDYVEDFEADDVPGVLPAGSTHWVSALSGLRELAIKRSRVPDLVQALATLPHLHTLVLDDGSWSDSGIDEGQLLEALSGLWGVLVRLELAAGWHNAWDAAMFQVLGSMRRLRVLSLPALPRRLVGSVHRDLLLPPSLTRCYVPGMACSYLPGGGMQPRQGLRQLQARYPWVSFKTYRRPGDDEW